MTASQQPQVLQWRRGDFTISTDRRRINERAVHAVLTTSYWSPGISAEVVRAALDHSLVFGLYRGDQQVGLARVVTDHATYAYLCDVYVDRDFQGQGLGTWLLEAVSSYPTLQGLRRWSLRTRDAHGLYRKFGFTPVEDPERCMEKVDPDVYARLGAADSS